MTEFGFQPMITGKLATPERLRRHALAAEELGYDTISVTDHVAPPLGFSSRYPYSPSGVMSSDPTEDRYDIFALLGLWTGITSKIKLQTSVLVLPYRNPIVAANVLASIDVLSGGRLEVGIGAGWLEEEFEILHAPDFKVRGQVTDEYIQIFRTLWDDERPSFDGRHYQISNLAMFPKPLHKPRLPIIVGGTTDAALRRAARFADGWQALLVTAADVERGVQLLTTEADRAGRTLGPDFQISVRFSMRVTERPTELREAEKSNRVIVGTPTEIAAQLRPFVAAGATAFMLDIRTCDESEGEQSLELFSREVIPQFR